MKTSSPAEPNYDELVEKVGYDFGLKRRAFVQILGAGFLLTASMPGVAQREASRRGFISVKMARLRCSSAKLKRGRERAPN